MPHVQMDHEATSTDINERSLTKEKLQEMTPCLVLMELDPTENSFTHRVEFAQSVFYHAVLLVDEGTMDGVQGSVERRVFNTPIVARKDKSRKRYDMSTHMIVVSTSNTSPMKIREMLTMSSCLQDH